MGLVNRFQLFTQVLDNLKYFQLAQSVKDKIIEGPL